MRVTWSHYNSLFPSLAVFDSHQPDNVTVLYSVTFHYREGEPVQIIPMLSFCYRFLISCSMYLRKRRPRMTLWGILLLLVFSILLFEMLPFHSEEHTPPLNQRESDSSVVESREVSLAGKFYLLCQFLL